jgi:hypothetical protein
MYQSDGDFFATLRLYAVVIVAAPVALFAGVEGWRGLVLLSEAAAPSNQSSLVSSADLVWVLPYGLTVAGFLAVNAMGRGSSAFVGVALGALQAAGITASLYGVIDRLRALLGGPAGLDVIEITCLGTTALMVFFLAFRFLRRPPDRAA